MSLPVRSVVAKAAFISHASKNFKLADEIRVLLEKQGLECWIAPRDIPPGGDYADVIVGAIQNCTAIVLVMTEEANNSKMVPRELELAVRHERVIIPVRFKAIEPSSSLAFYLSTVQWVDACFTPLKRRIDEIANVIRAAQSGLPLPKPAPEHKTLLGSVERALEGAIRYKLLTLSVVVALLAVLGGAAVFNSSRTVARLEADDELISHDPSAFGLVTLAVDEMAAPTNGTIALRGVIHVNLRDPANVKLRIRTLIRTTEGKVAPFVIPSMIPFNVSGAQIMNFEAPIGTVGLVFCMTANHPKLTGEYTASWAFAVDGSKSPATVTRVAEPSLVKSTEVTCE